MKLLADWTITHQGHHRTIELYQGDLAALPPQHAVDILVVSAFPNDYAPVPGTVISSLAAAGISVQALARDKQTDLRDEFSCWISHPVPNASNFKRILCIESGWRGTPPQITDDIFRALAPASMAEFAEASVAVPLIGTGNQGYPAGPVMASLLRAAVFWLRRGLKIRTLKIVVKSDATAQLAQQTFLAAKAADAPSAPTPRPPAPVRRPQSIVEPPPPPSPPAPAAAPAPDPAHTWDIFLSYARKNPAAPDLFDEPPPPVQLAPAEPNPPSNPLPAPPAPANTQAQSQIQTPRIFDIFLSYAHQDAAAAEALRQQIAKVAPNARVFYDKHSLVAGGSWLMDIALSLDGARRVAALYTPHYWASKYCKDEFTAALLRQNDTGHQILFPIYFQQTDIPYFFRSLQHVDCRESDLAKLTEACNQLCKNL